MLRLIAVVAALSLGSILLGLGLSANLDSARSVDDAALVEGAGGDAVDRDRADESQSADESELMNESDGAEADGENQTPDESGAGQGDAAGVPSGEEPAAAGDRPEDEGDGEGGFTMTRSNPPPPGLPQ